MSKISVRAMFQWPENDGVFVQGIADDLHGLGARPVFNKLFGPTDEAPRHSVQFDVIPGLADKAAGILAGVADAGGTIHITITGAEGEGETPRPDIDWFGDDDDDQQERLDR